LKKTKIVCTIGPASESREILKELLNAGMNMMRLNFSHGSYEEHGARIKTFREIKKELGKKAAIMLDNKGPEIRTMRLDGGRDISIVGGQEFIFTTNADIIGNNKIVAVTYDGFAKDLKLHDTILVDDGLLEFTVTEVTNTEVKCIAKNNGDLGENKGVNLPNTSVNLPALSEKDKSDLKFGCEQGVDYIAASFIRKAVDVMAVRKCLAENGGGDIKIISKIENQEGLDNFDEILAVSDGIMVARGDLGVEIPLEEVPFAQKMMINKCNMAGKVVITATQMLDSMIKNPRPTRAEVNDVTNAILDGTDAVMLSGESAKGKYPVESVKVMSKIAEKTDPLIGSNNINYTDDVTITSAIAKGAADIAEALNAKVIVVGTQSGRAAREMRIYCPRAQILAITNKEKTANQLMINRGIVPYLDPNPETMKSFFELSEVVCKELKLADIGDIIVAVCGESVFKPGTTNSVKIIQIK
jgi:pyruvate kinase